MSASSTPTLCPAAASAAARFTVTDDLPTPPFPLATAYTRVSELGSANGMARSGRPPRSRPCSSRRCSSLITSRCTSTPDTPGTAVTAAVTSLVMVSRSGQPATVRYTSTRTLPAGPTSTLFTMPRSVMGRRISGSLTLASAAVTCSAVGGETTEGAAMLPMLCAWAGRSRPAHTPCGVRSADGHTRRRGSAIERRPRHQPVDDGICWEFRVEPGRRQWPDDPGPLRRPAVHPGDAGRPGDQRAAGLLARHGDRRPAGALQPRQRLLARPGHQVRGSWRVPPQVPGRIRLVLARHGQPNHPAAFGGLRDHRGRGDHPEHAPFVEGLHQPGGERDAGHFGHAEPSRVIRVIPRREHPPGNGGRVVPDSQDPAIGRRPVHRADQRAGDHLQPGLLADLADQGLLVGFPRLDPPPGQRPAAGLGLVPAPDEQEPPALGEDRADTWDAQLRHGPKYLPDTPSRQVLDVAARTDQRRCP